MMNLPRILRLPIFLGFMALLYANPTLFAQQENAAKQGSNAQSSPEFTLKTTVNRVLLDVTVTDAHGNPVHGLTRDDFSVEEDGRPQTLLSFDAYNFDKGMDYTPPKFPPLAPNTFLNLPSAPERGPLYVLFYDLVNIPNENQVFARKQLVRFIENKPAGARFAIFVSSDGLHLVQGFTSDQQELFAAVDPKSSRPHVPEIFMMGVNFGQGDKLATATRLNLIAAYLSRLPGRKNLIWLSSDFPLSFFPSKDDTVAYREQVKKTLDMLAANQIAVYPVDVSGVVLTEVYAPPGAAGDSGISTDDREKGVVFPQAALPHGAVPPNPNYDTKATGGAGYSLTASGYMTEDSIAKITGGEAIYSSNDVTESLEKVAEDGGNYYTLAYSPTNKNFDGNLRQIHVDLNGKQYRLSYRRAYYGVNPDTNSEDADEAADTVTQALNDKLSADMEHGAPTVHQLIFGVHVATAGKPAIGTREQMANLEKQTASLTKGGKASEKHMKPIPLQVYMIDYTVMAQQFEAAGETSPDIQIAAAAYDSDGRLLNTAVNRATVADSSAAGQRVQRSSYRMEQQFDVPLDAKFIRIGVLDDKSGKVGAMEIPLPLAPVSQE